MIQVSPELWIQTMNAVIEIFLKPKFISLGMNASGKWLNSLEGRYNNGRGEIWGMDYTYYLANGRRPGKRPPVTPLISWVGNKFGITGREGISIAYAIANKIAKEGTDYYPEGTDLIEVLNSKEVLNFVYSELGSEIAISFKDTLTQYAKKIFANA